MTGRVYLVGAGPGDPGLLTARALELISQADAILYDRLIPQGALEHARGDAELLYVGKEGWGESVPQEQTQAAMVERARAGKTVVRLKGGDPFVFGRGGEEALALREQGIAFEVVPGVTAGLSAGAYAGIPATHRGLASAVALVTAHEDPEKGETALDWEALGRFPGTLVLYMGVGRLRQGAQALIAGGRAPSEPVAIVEAGTLPRQRTISGTLADIAESAAAQDVRPPSVTIVGPVAALAEQIAWFAPGPLAGLTVAVTRARAQASELAGRLRSLGAEVVQAPTIRVQPLPGPPLDPTPYDLVCVTSANGVSGLFERLDDGTHPPGDARSLAGATVAAIGLATARALAQHGVVADVVPERAVAESLAQALAGIPVKRALLATARGARDVLAGALAGQGAEVEVLELYETVAEALPARTLAAARSAHYITFTSSSTVRFFLEAAGGRAELSPRTRIVSIGPITSAALREHGLEPDVESDRADAEGMIDALLTDASRRARDGR